MSGRAARPRAAAPRGDWAGAAWWLVGGCVLVAAALRLYGLEQQSLWNDELSALTKASRLGDTHGVFTGGVPPDHPPGFLLFLHLWIRFLGDAEGVLRLPSALAGIALVPAMYALGSRLYGRREGVIAAALTATAWAPVYYSQEARSYSLLLLGVVLSSLCLVDVLRALRHGAAPPAGAAIGYVLAAVCTSYLHYFGLFFVCLQAVLAGGLCLRRPRALGWMAALYGAVLLAYLPWLSRAAVAVSGGPGWTVPPRPRALWELVSFLFNRADALAALAVAAWVALALRGLWTARRGGAAPHAGATAVLFAWLLVPPLIVYVRSQYATPVFLERALLIVLPAAYLLLARAVTHLSPRRWHAPLAAALIAWLLVDLLVVQRYHVRPTKQQFREAAAHLIARDDGGASTVVLAAAHNRKYFDYYLARLGSARRVDHMAATPAQGAEARALVTARAPAHVWLLAGHRRPDPALLDWLTARHARVDQVELLRTQVWHFSSPP